MDGWSEWKGEGECGCDCLGLLAAVNGYLNGIDWNCDSRWVCLYVVSIWKQFLFGPVWGILMMESGSVIQNEWLFRGQCDYCCVSSRC